MLSHHEYAPQMLKITLSLTQPRAKPALGSIRNYQQPVRLQFAISFYIHI